MSVIVQKFGGTSVANLDKIRMVANKIAEEYKKGKQIAVVVSARAGDTDHLESLARQISNTPNLRELDVLLSTGEQITIALLSMMLIEMGMPAQSYTGGQVPIVTEQSYSKAKILSIDSDKIQKDLKNGKIAVVAGFQGVSQFGNITTLGRGGSDTTAVALAAAINADECQIFTDVDGVYTADPKIVPRADKLDEVTFEEMLELSSLGSKVLQIRAVEIAGKHKIPVRVMSTFQSENTAGTLISYSRTDMEARLVSGVAMSIDEAQITVSGIKDVSGLAGRILGPISSANIIVDMLVYTTSNNGFADFSFTISRRDLEQAKSIVSFISKELQAKEVFVSNKVAKISLVGVGIKDNPGIASKMFRVLGGEGINIKLMSTSEIKVSVIVDEKYTELGVRALHEAFNLSKDVVQPTDVANEYC